MKRLGRNRLGHKRLGLIGGISWQSTHSYHKYLNELVAERLGGSHSAKLLINAFDFHEIEALQMAGDWAQLTQLMIESAQTLERGGADGLIICANTMHQMADEMQRAIDIPIIHIVDALAERIKQTPVEKPILLATRYVMEQDFYTGRLRASHNINPLIPDGPGREVVHKIIFDELIKGVVNPASKSQFLELIEGMRNDGADGLILGCTELGMILDQSDFEIPAFDSTRIHAEVAVDYMLN